MERWKDVVGFEGYYQVSDLGRVRSVDRVVRGGRGKPVKRKGKIRKLSPYSRSSGSGHLAAHLYKEGVLMPVGVHRLVLAAWVGPCPEGCEVRHGPNGVTDNSVGNLSYGTRSQNSLDQRRDGTDGGRKVVRSDGAEFASVNQAAEESDCHASAISRTCRGKGNSAGGYGWKYADEGPEQSE